MEGVEVKQPNQDGGRGGRRKEGGDVCDAGGINIWGDRGHGGREGGREIRYLGWRMGDRWKRNSFNKSSYRNQKAGV